MINPIHIQRAVQTLLSSVSTETFPIMVKKASNLRSPEKGSVYVAWSYDPSQHYQAGAEYKNQEEGSLELAVFSTDKNKREDAYSKVLNLLCPEDDIYQGQVENLYFNSIRYEDSIEINGFKSGDSTTDIPGQLFTFSVKVSTNE